MDAYRQNEQNIQKIPTDFSVGIFMCAFRRTFRGKSAEVIVPQKNVNAGYVYVVEMDLEQYFGTVCQSKLIEVLSRTIRDGRVISLIYKYLNAGVTASGMFDRTEIGMPQGGLLSSLFTDIMLIELDKELERREHRFVRYADEWVSFCSFYLDDFLLSKCCSE